MSATNLYDPSSTRLVHCLDREGAFHEGQAGCRVNRSCMDVFTLNENCTRGVEGE